MEAEAKALLQGILLAIWHYTFLDREGFQKCNAVWGLWRTSWQIHYQVWLIKNLLKGKQVHHIYEK